MNNKRNKKKFYGAIGRNDCRAVSYLLSTDFSLIDSTYKSFSPITKAVSCNRLDVTRYLLIFTENLNPTYEGFNIIHWAINNRIDYSIIELLCNYLPLSEIVDIHLLHDFVEMIIPRHNCDLLFEVLISYVPDINQCFNQENLLSLALREGDVKYSTIKIILNSGADIWTHHLKYLPYNHKDVIGVIQYNRLFPIKHIIRKILYNREVNHIYCKLPDEIWGIIYEFV
jgi:hypothetical protein|tara:strand:+ start:702 stop:1382 length:681 start_codon:yes stop_codon:yes gene_type:complete